MAKVNGKSKPNGATVKRPVSRNEKGQVVAGSGPINPDGRGAKGETWGEIFHRYFNMSLDEVAKQGDEISKRIRKYGKGKMTVKELSALRYIESQLFDPNSSMFNSIADRMEGKVTQPIQLSVADELKAKAQELGIDVQSDPLLAELFTAAGVEGFSPEADGSTSGSAEAGQ